MTARKRDPASPQGVQHRERQRDFATEQCARLTPSDLRSSEKMRSRTDHAGAAERAANRRAPDGRPGRYEDPKPPPVGVLYEDLAERVGRVPKKVFGQYPAMLIPKLLPWFLCERREIVHVCSGSLKHGEGIRVDIRPDAAPDVLADGRALPFADGSVKAVMLDPPYTEHYAKVLYGTKYPRPRHLLIEAARVVRRGGRIVFVHYITPNPPPGCRLIKVFGLSTGFGFPVRAVTIYEREQGRLL